MIETESMRRALDHQSARIEAACRRVGRDPSSVTLVAVSKQQPAERIEEALAHGQTVFGESYAQELAEKAERIGDHRAVWHFVGHLQTNKVAAVAPWVQCVHSVDRGSLIDALAKRTPRPLDVFVQVNLAQESSKRGCAPTDVHGLLRRIVATSSLRPVGLMVLPPLDDSPEASRDWFRALRLLRDEVRARLVAEGHDMSAFTGLSMGMSDDLEVAVEEGATHVRVGTALFGLRPASAPLPPSVPGDHP